MPAAPAAAAAIFFGDDAAKARQYAWFKPHSEGMPHPVGRKLPNAWGLYDMLGNVWEWCNDWYGEGYYQESPGRDPRGPAAGKQRVLRGGPGIARPRSVPRPTVRRSFPSSPTPASAPIPTVSGGCEIPRQCRRSRLPRRKPGRLPRPPIGQGMICRSPRPCRYRARPRQCFGRTDEIRARATASAAAPAPSGGKLEASQLQGTIVFVSDRSGTLNIWSMRANGSDPKPLTRGTDPHADPRFSPDGKSILYTVLHGGFPEVWVMDRDGSAPRKITPGCQADWSPDGRQIAFIRDNQVWVRELASGRERRVTPEAWERCGVPAWRPDGKQLAVASRHTGAIGIYSSQSRREREYRARHRGAKLHAMLVERRATAALPDRQRPRASGGRGRPELGAGDLRRRPATRRAVLARRLDDRLLPRPAAEGPWKICVSRLGDDELDFLPIATRRLQPATGLVLGRGIQKL